MDKSSKNQIPAVTKNMPAMDYKYTDCKEELGTEPAPEEAEPERGTWTGRFDFLLSLLGYSVGLGNVWRFPYLCYNNGGGAFLIPFTVMLIIAGLPLMFMELSFGQYAALGPVAVYNKFCPLFRGLGYGMVIVSCIVMLYYNLIIAWTIYYMAVSFVSIFYQLPWQNCESDWSTEHCYSYEEADACEANNGTFYLRQCYNQTHATELNIAALAEKVLRRPPAEEYFTNQVLGLSSGIEEMGQVRLGMAVCLLAAWIIVFLCLCKGVQSSGKVVYFTALFPYVVLVILFFRGVTLPGASTGILFYLTPDFSRLASAQVWGDAAVQIFFALSPAWGGLITLSSYNKFSNNCYIDSLIVAVSNIATSFFAGLVIFSVIGFLAHELNVEVDRVVDQGAGLAFIVYPEVVTRLPIAPLWSILFFVMLLTLGLDSQFALMETVTTAILDRFPNFRQKKVWVVLTVAAFGYIGGLIFTTNSGMYWLQLMDKYAANWSVLIIAIGECVLIAWIYGAENFCRDIQRMIGRQSKLWVVFWSAMWRVITPAALVFILVFNWIEYKPASYGHYVYPMWADAVGWTIGVLPVMVVVLMAIDQICSGPDDLTIMEASQDGGDSTSITSGIENEIKRPGAGIMKSKKNSIKKRVQSLSHDADDGVVEPLLPKDKENSENVNQSAKFMLSKTKTESSDEKDKLLADNKVGAPSMTTVPGITENHLRANGIKDSQITKIYASSAPIHNHMNSNLFASNEITKSAGTPKTQILVEIDVCKYKSYSPTPLIFTTAKIHTNGKNKPLEPVQVTPVPILSTIEGKVVKTSTTDKDITSIYNTTDNISSKPILTSTGHTITTTIQGTKVIDKLSTAKCTVSTADNKTISNFFPPTSVVSSAQEKSLISETDLDKISPQPLNSTSVETNNLISGKIKEKPKMNTPATTQHINIVNSNIQSVSNSKSSVNNSTTTVKNKETDASTDVSSKDKILRTESNSAVNKQLQRQNNTAKENSKKNETSKVSDSNKIPKEQGPSIDSNKSQDSKQTDSKDIKTVKTVIMSPKTDAKTISSTPSSKTTTVLTATNKLAQSSLAGTKSTTSITKPKTETVKSTVSDSKVTTTFPSPVSPSTVSPMKVTPATTSISSSKHIGQNNANAALKLEKSSSVVAKTTNTSTITSAKPSNITTTKSTSLSSTASAASGKPSTVKTIIPDRGSSKTIASAVAPNDKSHPSKSNPSTVTTMKASASKTTNITKTVPTKTVSHSVGASNTTKSTQSDLHRSDHSKDGKPKP